MPLQFNITHINSYLRRRRPSNIKLTCFAGFAAGKIGVKPA